MDYVITPGANWTFSQLAREVGSDNRLIVGQDLLDARLARSYRREYLKEQLQELKGLLIQPTNPEKASPEELAKVAERLKPTLDRRLAMPFPERGWDEEYEKLLYQRAVVDVEYFERVMKALNKDRDKTTGAYSDAVAVVSAFTPRVAGGAHVYFAAANIPTQTTRLLKQWTKTRLYGELLFVDWLNLAGFIFCGLFLLILLPVIGLLIWQWAKELLPEGRVEPVLKWALAVPSALFIGLCLYSFRGHQRFLYGILEYFFGVMVTADAVPTLDNFGFEWLKVAAGLYVVVRGLDNVGKGIEKSKAVEWPELWDRWKQRFGTQH